MIGARHPIGGAISCAPGGVLPFLVLGLHLPLPVMHPHPVRRALRYTPCDCVVEGGGWGYNADMREPLSL